MNFSALILIGTAFLLGLRHGIDWDHIAAISDITGTMESRRKGFFMGTMYALGHATVVLCLGIAAVAAGVLLSGLVEAAMGRLVGITLILLGIWILFSLLRDRHRFRLRSRWMLVFAGVRYLWYRIRGKFSKASSRPIPFVVGTYGARTSFAVGIIHGIGAETASQLLLFVSAAGAGHAALGSVAVAAFVTGLVISNSAITITSSLGFLTAQRNTNTYMILGGLAGAFSLIVGVAFLLGIESVLPAFFGG